MGFPVPQLHRVLVLLRGDRCLLVPAHAVQGGLGLLQADGHGPHPEPHPGGRLVHEVDGLVGKEAVSYVTRREVGRGVDGILGDGHLVMRLVALLDAIEYGNGLLHGGLFHVDGLEAPLQGSIPLHMLAVVVQGSGADALQLSAGQRRLQDVGGVHRSLGGPGAHYGVHLVDEQHALARALELFNDLLQPLLELAPVLGARHQRAHVHGYHPLPLQGMRHGSGHDAVGQPFHDGGLAHPWLSDEDRVVLGAPGQYLDDPLDLLLSSDDRLQLPRPGHGRQVHAQLIEGRRLAGAAGRLRRLHGPLVQDAGRLRPGPLQADPQALQNAARHPLALPQEAQEQVFGPDIAMVQAPGFVHRQLDYLLGPRGQAHLGGGRLASPPDDELHRGAYLVQVHLEVLKHLGGHTVGLPDQSKENVLSTDIVVIEPLRFFLSVGERPPRPFGELLKPACHIPTSIRPHYSITMAKRKAVCSQIPASGPGPGGWLQP